MSQTPLYALIYLDRPGASDLRARLRPDHLRYLGDRALGLQAAGPLLDDAGQAVGSLLIFQTDHPQDLEVLAAGDPYVAGEVIETVKVLRWGVSHWTLAGSPLEDVPSKT